MYILVLRARRFFEVVFVRKPTEGVALVTRKADLYERRDACRTLYFIAKSRKILQYLV